MPTLVRVAAAADDDSSGLDDTTMELEESGMVDHNKDSDESEVLETSVNMLLDDTIHSGSDCESSASDTTISKKGKTSYRNAAPTGGTRKDKRKDDCEKSSASRERGAVPGRVACDNEDPNDITRLSDSDSSLDTPQKEPKCDKQNPAACQIKRNSNSKVFSDRDGHRHPSYAKEQANGEIRFSSDSDSMIDTPPRRQKTTTKSQPFGVRSPPQEVATRPMDNDETRLSDSNWDSSRETRYPSTPPQRASNNPASEGTRSSQRGQDSKREAEIVFQSCRPSPKYLEWKQQKSCYEFQSKFKSTVSSFEKRNPRVKLRDYKSLSSEDQVREQHKVINLLDRLGIRTKSLENGPVNSTLDDPDLDRACPQDMSATRIDSPIQSTNQNRSENQRQKPSSQTRQELVEKCARQSQQKKSSLEAVQLSPIAGASPNRESFRPSVGANFSPDSPGFPPAESPGGCGGGNSPSELSVEITRGADDDQSLSPSRYRSPELQMSDRSNSKRQASRSGKRGKDSFRVKLNEPSRVYSSGSDDEGMPPPAPSWHSSDDSISLLSAQGHEQHRGHPFTASQSPIQDYQVDTQRHRGRDDHRERSRSVHWSSGDRRPDKNHDRDSHRRGHEASSSRRRKDRHRNEDRSRHKIYDRRDDRQRYYYDDTIDTVNATAFRGPERRARSRDTTNVALKEGVAFHYNPLQIKRTKRTSKKERTTRDYPRHDAVDFRDPLGEYVGEEGEKLCHVFEWTKERDRAGRVATNKWNSDSKGIIFSLEMGQIVNVVIKFLIESDQEREDRFEDVSSLSGKTLLVVRSKDDIALWEQAFREHSPFSVMSHAALPSSKRKKFSTASECATYDIVVTTYDAMKSQDVTVQLDEDGHVLLGHEAESQATGGWMTKRVASSTGASSQRFGGCSQRPGGASQRFGGDSQRVDLAAKCKQYSVLHRLQWRRILFMDDLGRKCYLAKFETARAAAAAALNGQSRFIFFGKEKDEMERCGFECLMRSDRNAIQSVAAVLRMETEDEDEDLLDVILDPAQGI